MQTENSLNQKSSRSNGIEELLLSFSTLLILFVFLVGTFAENLKCVSNQFQTAAVINTGQIDTKRVATAPTFKYATDHILVKFKDNVGQDKKAAVFAKHGLKEQKELSHIGWEIVSISSSDKPENAVNRIKTQEQAAVQDAEVDRIVEVQHVTPNDPLYSQQWHLQKIQAPAAWDTTTGSSAVIIADVDTGINPAHTDLSANIIPGWNVELNSSDTSDNLGHGTAVAGTAVAVANNGIGVASVCWSCRIMPVKVSDLGEGYLSIIVQGVIYAANHGARVINVSWGPLEGDQAFSAGAQYAQSKGSTVVVPAGNNSLRMHMAVDDPSILFVSATDQNDNLASFSDTGNAIDLSAPGVEIETTDFGGGYKSVEGTSFSAPIVAGVAALLYSIKPTLTPLQVRETLEESADDLGPTGWDPKFGFGRVNATKAITMAVSGTYWDNTDKTPPSSPANLTASVIPNSDVITLTWSASTDNVAVGGYNLYHNGHMFYQILPKTSFTDITVDGTYNYQVQAFDRSGNSSYLSSSTDVAVVDKVPPTVTTTFSDSTNSVVQGTVHFDVCAFDNTQLSPGVIMVNVNNAPFNTQPYMQGGAADQYGRLTNCNSYAWDTTKVTNGSYTFTATAQDIMGNIGNSTPVTVTVRNPTVNFTASSAYVVIGSNQTFTLSWVAQNANYCWLSDTGVTKTFPVSYSVVRGPITTNTTYTLTCVNSNVYTNVSVSKSVTVAAVTAKSLRTNN